MAIKKQYEVLKKGDLVDILAPAFGIHERDLKKIEEYLSSLGLRTRYPKNFMQGDLVCSATAEVRFEQLRDALFAEDSKAIWCVKGGGGSPQIIPYLNKITPPEKQKLFIAFSDITSIHFFLNQKWGWQTVHGPILWQIARERVDAETIQQIENIVFGRNYKNEFELKPISKNINSSEIKSEAVLGGNLKLVQCSIGTIWKIEPKNKILLFEDINETPYQVDRILTHINQSNLFDGAAAIIFGDFEGENMERDMPLIEKLLDRFANETTTPVFRVEGIGHKEKNWAIHFGVPAKISLKKDGIYSLKISDLE